MDEKYKVIAQPELGQRIKKCRKARKMTQRELGQCVGVSYQTVAYWESGARVPAPGHLRSVAIALGESEMFFFRLDEQEDERNFHISGLSENLRKQRLWFPISQKELAERTGISLNKIKAYEDGSSGVFISEADLERLVSFFSIESRELLGNSTTEEEMIKIYTENSVRKIQDALELLNPLGLDRAVERVTELTELSRYRK